MKLQPGITIESTSLLNGTPFEKTVVLITEYNHDGAVGFVTNKPFPRKLNELEEFKHDAALALFDGGPVDREHLFFIHRRPDLIEGGVCVGANIYTGGNFKQALNNIKLNIIAQEDIKVFIGYCGWDATELEQEIDEGSWKVRTAPTGFSN